MILTILISIRIIQDKIKKRQAGTNVKYRNSLVKFALRLPAHEHPFPGDKNIFQHRQGLATHDTVTGVPLVDMAHDPVAEDLVTA
jgi:hypothetical protein